MYEMTFRLQTDTNTCLYEQIYNHIKADIIDGKLKRGERLPSTRSLAEHLQVARSTVDYAYGQLQGEGYIESRPYKGYFVCSVEGLLKMERSVAGFRAKDSVKESDELMQAANIGVARDAGKGNTVAISDELYDFSPYAIDMTGFPFSVWKKITKNVLTDANSELFLRGEAQGDYQLRRTISRYLYSSRGVSCVPEQVIVGAGNDYLLMLLEKILGRHVSVAMENPTYKRSYRIFQSFAYEIATVDMDESGMKVSDLAALGVRVAYVMPSHQFPTGTVMPIGRRMELLKWANQEENRYLIEDDYDSEFRYRGKPIPALQASDENGKVIYIGTFSKAIAPAIRVSFMVLPPMLLEKYKRDCFFYSCTVSRIDQSILNVFIGEGYFERHLNRMRKIYRGKHELLLECLKPLRGQFRISGENAGLHLLLTSEGGIPEAELIEKARNAGVRVYGLSESMVEENPDSTTILLGYGGLSDEQIIEGTDALKKAWL